MREKSLHLIGKVRARRPPWSKWGADGQNRTFGEQFDEGSSLRRPEPCKSPDEVSRTEQRGQAFTKTNGDP